MSQKNAQIAPVGRAGLSGPLDRTEPSVQKIARSSDAFEGIAAASVGVIVGSPFDFRLQAAKVDEDGVPLELLIFPTKFTVDTEEGEQTFICDDESQKAVLANFKRRGNPIPIDYEHQTMKGGIAPAAGRFYEMIAGGKKGLIAASIRWTRRARAFLADEEYFQHSPVWYYDRKTMRVIALHSVALTNKPATHNQKSLNEQIAAKAMADYKRIAAKEEGGMKELISSLRYTLGLRATDSVKDLKASLAKIQKALDKLDDDTMIVEAKTRIGELVAALKPIDSKLALAKVGADDDGDDDPVGDVREAITEFTFDLLEQAMASVDDSSAAGTSIVASKEVLELLELPETADLPTIQAKVIELRTPADMVPRSEHEKVVAELAAAKAETATVTAKTDEEKLNTLIASNRAKISPAREPFVRQAAAKFGLEHAAQIVASWKDELPQPQAEGTEPDDDTALEIAKTVTVDGREYGVKEDKAVIVAKVRRIMKAKGVSYDEANELRKKEEMTAR